MNYKPPFRIRPCAYRPQYRDACIEDSTGREVDLVDLLDFANAATKNSRSPDSSEGMTMDEWRKRYGLPVPDGCCSSCGQTLPKPMYPDAAGKVK